MCSSVCELGLLLCSVLYELCIFYFSASVLFFSYSAFIPYTLQSHVLWLLPFLSSAGVSMNYVGVLSNGCVSDLVVESWLLNRGYDYNRNSEFYGCGRSIFVRIHVYPCVLPLCWWDVRLWRSEVSLDECCPGVRVLAFSNVVRWVWNRLWVLLYT